MEQHGGRKYLQELREGASGQVETPSKMCRKYVEEQGYEGQGHNGWS